MNNFQIYYSEEFRENISFIEDILMSDNLFGKDTKVVIHTDDGYVYIYDSNGRTKNNRIHWYELIMSDKFLCAVFGPSAYKTIKKGMINSDKPLNFLKKMLK